jgi:outer membrane protein assembly factor BamD
MKEKIKSFYKCIPLIFFLILLYSCSSNDELILKPEKTPELSKLYKKAFDLYEDGRWSESIKSFQKVETKYSFSEWAPKASLMIMYIYYEGGEYYSALEYGNRFKKLYANSKNLDYVDYIMAMCFYEQIDNSARDQTYTKEALKRFKNLIKEYPNSIYAEEVYYKLDLINEQLAGKEIYIARFYMKKSKWIPAIKRLKNIVNNYDQTIYIEEALHRLVEIYYKLGNIKESKKYAAILGYNFNDSNWYKKTYKIVVDKNYSIHQKKQKKKFRDRIKKMFQFSK